MRGRQGIVDNDAELPRFAGGGEVRWAECQWPGVPRHRAPERAIGSRKGMNPPGGPVGDNGKKARWRRGSLRAITHTLTALMGDKRQARRIPRAYTRCRTRPKWEERACSQFASLHRCSSESVRWQRRDLAGDMIWDRRRRIACSVMFPIPRLPCTS